MIFSLAVYAAPSVQASDSAYRFATALLAQGHSLYRVFFYIDGVHHGSEFVTPPQDEINIPAQWQHLAQTHNVDLVICIASALRRGILNDTEAERYEKSGSNLASGFTIGGLGQLLDAAVTSDRLITFGS
jgi:tRNA 2-thiouridine synthesizing protein D